jgi:hypothetical protein
VDLVDTECCGIGCVDLVFYDYGTHGDGQTNQKDRESYKMCSNHKPWKCSRCVAGGSCHKAIIKLSVITSSMRSVEELVY